MQATPKVQKPSPPPRPERWLEVLRCLFPHARLVTACHPSDPVHALALPDGDPPEDACMVSIYYLSFYE